MNCMKLLAVALLAGLLSGCYGNIDAVRDASPNETWQQVLYEPATGAGFNAALARDYRALMLYEADEMADYISADMYADRSLAAREGKTVPPFELDDFDLPDNALPSLREARYQIGQMYAQGSRERFPQMSARLQSSFDCWVEQQEENHQPTHIAACRDRFVSALNALKKAMAPTVEPTPAVVPAPTFAESYTIYFPLNSAEISAADRDTVLEAVRALQAQNAGASIIGHTDTSGSDRYNQSLSERRARAVANLLLDAGIRPAVVTTEGRGESDLATQTADGVVEQTNRRAVINIR